MDVAATSRRAALGGVAASVALWPLAFHGVRGVMEARAPEPSPAALLWAVPSRALEQMGVAAWLVAALALVLAPWCARHPVAGAHVSRGCVALGVAAAALLPAVGR